MPKTSPIIALGASFLAIFGSLAIFALAEAATILVDDFNSYSNGGLTGQNDWANYYQSCVVVNGAVGCGDDGLHGNYKEGNTLSSGSMSVDFRVYSDEKLSSLVETGFGGIWISPWPFGSSLVQLSIYYNNADGIYLNGVAGKFFLDDPDEWHTATVIWDETAADWYVDDTLIYEDIPTEAADYTTVAFGVFPAGASMWIDNIREGSPSPIAGYAPILTPTTPPRNTETIVDFDAGFEVAGTVQIPTSNSNIYTDLVLTFRAPDSFLPAETFVIDIGELTSGQSYNYSATTTVPITSSGDNFFKVGYTLLGSPYGGSFLNPPINEELLAFDNTWVKDSADDAPDYLITPSIKPDQPALEDCSAYSGADKIFCEFRNFVVGAFLPSDSALNQIGATMSALQNKFPVNYARAVGDTFSDISESVNDSATISFNLLGASGAVDTSIFTAELGDGITMGGTIKTIITLLVLTVFAFWAVGYMHRILR